MAMMMMMKRRRRWRLVGLHICTSPLDRLSWYRKCGLEAIAVSCVVRWIEMMIKANLDDIKYGNPS